MKRSILLFSFALSALGLTAFGVYNWNEAPTRPSSTIPAVERAVGVLPNPIIDAPPATDFIYDIGPRFGPIKKTKLDKVRTIADFLDAEAIASIISIQSVNVALFENEKQTNVLESGTTAALTEDQIRLLQSFDYSTSFVVRADYRKENGRTGIPVSDYRSPHLTVVPEQQAAYAHGKEALMNYLRQESMAVRVGVDHDTFKPAKLSFLITKKGTVKVLGLDRSSGYAEVDQKMIELISSLPGSWIPAKNMAGDHVEQELVVSFGLLGC